MKMKMKSNDMPKENVVSHKEFEKDFVTPIKPSEPITPMIRIKNINEVVGYDDTNTSEINEIIN
jgi:hypothetical protein